MFVLKEVDWPYWIFGMCTVLPIIGGVVSWMYKKCKKIRKRALLFDNIECKPYIHKEYKNVKLQVIYNNNDVYDALIVLKARISNIGEEDLSWDEVFADNIKIKCADKFEFINAVLSESYERIKPNVKIVNKKEIEVNWRLLKRKGYFDIEIIAKIDSENEYSDISIDFYNSLTIDINASGIDNVDKIKLQTKEYKRHRRSFIFQTIYMFLLWFMFIVLYVTYPNTSYYNLTYMVEIDSCQYISTIAYKPKFDSIVLEGMNSKDIVLPLSDLQQNEVLIKLKSIDKAQESAAVQRKSTKLYLYTGIFFTLITIALLIKKIIDRRKRLKMNN